jgi:hypothetical protein
MAGKRQSMMRPVERILCFTAGILGMAALIAGLVNGQEPAMVIGFGVYIVGFTAASLVAWRMH